MTAGDWYAAARVAELDATAAREFTLEIEGQALRGFLLRWEGEVRAFINRCPHTGVELNWMPDQFLDLEARFIQCSMHGALFEPASGLCIHGPCLGQSLRALAVRVEDDTVYVAPPT